MKKILALLAFLVGPASLLAGTTGRIPKFSSSSKINDSVMAQSGSTVTVTGSHIVTDRVGIATTTVSGSTLTVNGRIESLTGGIKFPDGSVQTSAAVAGTVLGSGTAPELTYWTTASTLAAVTGANFSGGYLNLDSDSITGLCVGATAGCASGDRTLVAVGGSVVDLYKPMRFLATTAGISMAAFTGSVSTPDIAFNFGGIYDSDANQSMGLTVFGASTTREIVRVSTFGVVVSTSVSANATSTLFADGSFGRRVRVVTSSYTLTAQDSVVLVNNAGTATMTLPPAAGITGRHYTIKKISGALNDVVTDANASETIDGATTYTQTLQYTSITIASDGSNWHIISSHVAAITP